MLVVAVGFAAWALGRIQAEGPIPGAARGTTGAGPSPDPFGGHEYTNGHVPPPGGYSGGAPPPQPQPNAHQPPPRPSPQPGWGRTAGTNTPPRTDTPKTAWEMAREETKRRAEEQKAAEDAKKRREENEQKLKEMREKDARERAEREKKTKEAEIQKIRAELEKKMAAEKAAKDDQAKAKSTYAFSATGEKVNPWPNGRPESPTKATPKTPGASRPPAPTARTYRGTDEDAYSYRPYDKPSTPKHAKAPSSVWSESSYAASQSTSRTTPPPSHRGPYSTKDPEKIVLKAVYSFNNTFLKTPTSQLISGVGNVTDGLILRITTEGLFIDDDVRGVPQREWDVKAWTMKLVEVWCPAFESYASPAQFAARASTGLSRPPNPVRRLWNMDKQKIATAGEAEALLGAFNETCKDVCRVGAAFSNDFASESSSAYSSAYSSASSPTGHRHNSSTNRHGQTGKNDLAGLHVLRASIRDQDGKRYVFVLTQEEAWKVTVGLGKLRKGSQVRALGVSAMSAADARTTLEALGWT